MAARNDFHWLRSLPISVYHICHVSFALRRSFTFPLSTSFTKSVHSKSHGAPKIRDLLSSTRVLGSLFPVLIVTCAIRSFRAQIYKHIGSTGIKKLCGISLPCLTKTPLSICLFRSPRASVFLIPSPSPGHGLLTLCMGVCVCFLYVFCNCVSV